MRSDRQTIREEQMLPGEMADLETGSIVFRFSDGAKIEFGVTSLPNRRSKALFKMRGANIDILAYFRNDGCAEQFMNLIDSLVERLSEKENK